MADKEAGEGHDVSQKRATMRDTNDPCYESDIFFSTDDRWLPGKLHTEVQIKSRLARITDAVQAALVPAHHGAL